MMCCQTCVCDPCQCKAPMTATEVLAGPPTKIVHRSFGVAANAKEVQIRANIVRYLGVLPVPIATPAGPIFIVMASVSEPVEAITATKILLPNGMAAPSTDEELPLHNLILVPEGEAGPPEFLYWHIGIAMGQDGPRSFYVSRL